MHNSSIFSQILRDFPEVLDFSLATRSSSHNVKCHIQTSGPPLKTPPRRLTPEKLAIARKPHLQDCLSRLSGCKFFSKIDLIKGYHQIPVAIEDVPKIAVATPFGLYEFLRMPFGPRNAAQAFQRLMDVATSNLEGVTVYLDDILVYSRTMEQHLAHLRALFKALSNYGLVINLAKCEFGKSDLTFPGHRITPNGVSPLQDRVTAITSFAKPSSIKGLQRYLGMVNFYRRFVPHIANLLRPLTDALANNPKTLTWTPQMANAFVDSKKALSKATTLAHHDPRAPLRLSTDASSREIAGVVEQIVDGVRQPLAFFSRRTSGAESRYSAYDLELLALYSSLLHFRHLLEGRKFEVFTDQRPLTRSFFKTGDPVSNRQRQQLAVISEFCTELSHVPGVENLVADSLSRQFDDEDAAIVSSISHQLADVNLLAIAREQHEDSEDLRQTSLQLRRLPVPGSSSKIVCDVLTGQPRIVLPPAWRLRTFLAIHNLAHPSGRISLQIISRSYVWPSMAADVKRWARSCEACQKSKTTRHTQRQVTPIPIPKLRFTHVHVDIVGPLPVVKGFRYLLTMIDRTTRWIETAPLPDITASTTTAAFIDSWVARFGVPATVTSDRGTQFTSDTWTTTLKNLGISASTTSAYHPQSNGMLERFHRTLKSSLRCVDASKNWLRALPWLLLGLRNAPREDTKASTAEIVYGVPLRIPGMCFNASNSSTPVEELFESRRNAKQFTHVALNTKKFKRHPFIPSSLKTTDFVFVRDDALGKPPLAPRYHGPYKILKKQWDLGTFALQLPDRQDTVAIDRLKTANLLD